MNERKRESKSPILERIKRRTEPTAQKGKEHVKRGIKQMFSSAQKRRRR